jgi:hypothetical protein
VRNNKLTSFHRPLGGGIFIAHKKAPLFKQFSTWAGGAETQLALFPPPPYL